MKSGMRFHIPQFLLWVRRGSALKQVASELQPILVVSSHHACGALLPGRNHYAKTTQASTVTDTLILRCCPGRPRSETCSR